MHMCVCVRARLLACTYAHTDAFKNLLMTPFRTGACVLAPVRTKQVCYAGNRHAHGKNVCYTVCDAQYGMNVALVTQHNMH